MNSYPACNPSMISVIEPSHVSGSAIFSLLSIFFPSHNKERCMSRRQGTATCQMWRAWWMGGKWRAVVSHCIVPHNTAKQFCWSHAASLPRWMTLYSTSYYCMLRGLILWREGTSKSTYTIEVRACDWVEIQPTIDWINPDRCSAYPASSPGQCFHKTFARSKQIQQC